MINRNRGRRPSWRILMIKLIKQESTRLKFTLRDAPWTRMKAPTSMVSSIRLRVRSAHSVQWRRTRSRWSAAALWSCAEAPLRRAETTARLARLTCPPTPSKLAAKAWRASLWSPTVAPQLPATPDPAATAAPTRFAVRLALRECSCDREENTKYVKKRCRVTLWASSKVALPHFNS